MVAGVCQVEVVTGCPIKIVQWRSTELPTSARCLLTIDDLYVFLEPRVDSWKTCCYIIVVE